MWLILSGMNDIRYGVTFTEEISRYRYFYLARTKNEMIEKLDLFLAKLLRWVSNYCSEIWR